MPKSSEYFDFVSHIEHQLPDDLPKDKEIPANKQDEMLWKKYELNRARWNAQMGEATREELIFLAKKGYFYHSTPKEYRRKPTKKSNYVR